VPRVLDLGFGGGDIPRALRRWAAADGIAVQMVAADPDPRAARYARRIDPGGAVEYLTASSADLVAAGEVFDVVVSNHLLHHLEPGALTAVLADSRRLSRSLVLHADIARSRIAYALYGLGSAPLGIGSYVREDGLLSIRRSFTIPELGQTLHRLGAPGWQVAAYAPFRLALRWAETDGPR
jgi:2-polyprenyl-3-methyl-5-hydroxy-6-metoxy-1,4-benzoquinol methylase